MTKNKWYTVMGGEHCYLVLRGLLEKPLSRGWSQSGKITCHNFENFLKLKCLVSRHTAIILHESDKQRGTDRGTIKKS